jgi:hypothetical protein
MPLFPPRTTGGLGAQEEQPGGLGGFLGGALGGLSRFNDQRPELLMMAGQLLKGEDPWPAIAYGQSRRKTKREDAEKMAADAKTRAYLKAEGFTDTQIDAAVANPTIMNRMLAKKGGDGMDEFGLVPQYGVDKDGNPVAIQFGKSGKATQAQLPEGVTLSKAPIKFDAGTHFVLLDPITRQPIGTIPKENYQEAYDAGMGTADAKARSEAKSGLPGAQGIASLIDMQIQDLKNDPYLPSMVGPVNSRLPNISGEAARVQSKIDQIQGGAFLQARQLLRGGGAITDYEGQKAEAAFVRMNQAQSVEDFKAALDEFNAAVQQGIRKLEAQAGVAAPSGGGGNQRLRYNPTTGELE